MHIFLLIAIGLLTGILSGIFGIGGGILIIPSLIYLLGFSQKLATGTSLAILLPPIGIAGAWVYYKNDNVDLQAAIIIAVMMLFGVFLGANLAHHLDSKSMKMMFGGLLIFIGLRMIFDVVRSG